MKHFLIWVFICSSIFAAGCSTSVYVKDLGNVEPGKTVDGIPFRIKERYEVALYHLEGGEYRQLDVKENKALLANQKYIYLLQLSGSPFSDSTVKVKVNPDNTLNLVNVTSSSKGQEALTELGAGLKTVADARAARDTARNTAASTAESQVVANEDAHITALDAQKEAILAKLELDALPGTSTAIERTTAELKLSRARVVANQKARRAGIALPFPDIGS